MMLIEIKMAQGLSFLVVFFNWMLASSQNGTEFKTAEMREGGFKQSKKRADIFYVCSLKKNPLKHFTFRYLVSPNLKLHN